MGLQERRAGGVFQRPNHWVHQLFRPDRMGLRLEERVPGAGAEAGDANGRRLPSRLGLGRQGSSLRGYPGDYHHSQTKGPMRINSDLEDYNCLKPT